MAMADQKVTSVATNCAIVSLSVRIAIDRYRPFRKPLQGTYFQRAIPETFFLHENYAHGARRIFTFSWIGRSSVRSSSITSILLIVLGMVHMDCADLSF